MAEFKAEDLKAINIDDFTFEDMEEFEELTGMQFEAALELPVLTDVHGKPIRDEKNRPVKASQPPVKVLVVLLYLANRNHIEGLTLADVKKVKIADVQWAAEEDPKEASDTK